MKTAENYRSAMPTGGYNSPLSATTRVLAGGSGLSKRFGSSGLVRDWASKAAVANGPAGGEADDAPGGRLWGAEEPADEFGENLPA